MGMGVGERQRAGICQDYVQGAGDGDVDVEEPWFPLTGARNLVRHNGGPGEEEVQVIVIDRD